MELKLTKEELEAIKYYKDEAFDNINHLLITDSRSDVMIASDEQDDDVKITYQKEETIKYLETIKTIYNAMLNSYFDKGRKKDWEFYYVANVSDVQKMKNEPYIDTFMVVNSVEILNRKDLILGNNQVIVKVLGDKDIPYIDLDEALQTNTKEFLISLFTEVKEVKEIEKITINNKEVKAYSLSIKPQELQDMKKEDRTALYNYIIKNSDAVDSNLIESANLEKENTINYEKIRELEKQVSDDENNINTKELEEDYGESQKELDTIALERVKNKLENLKDKSAETFEKIKNNSKMITEWKKNITVYLMSECEDIKKKIYEKLNAENEAELKRVKNYEIKERIKKEDLEKEKFENILQEVQTECLDNEVLVKRVIGDINKVINRQQRFAKIAGSIGASYSALNNAFEMKKNAEDLEELIEKIKTKVDLYKNSKRKEEDTKELLKISEVNNQVTILINYLNNPKTVAIKPKINRFEEMIVVEENELKRDIAKAILDVRGEAELKKLRDDTEIIENKNIVLKFIGMFTGKNKLDEFMLEQIDVRQNAIKRTLSKKLRLDFNYSIHELIAEIRMFIADNQDDELVAEDIIVLKDIENEIKKSFVVIESKVNDIISDKENKSLPISNKLSKKELIEIETYRFLNKYGYDLEEKADEKEAVYTDTTGKEIARISEYIITSNIL